MNYRHKETVANSLSIHEFALSGDTHFPSEGLCVGSFQLKMESFPALLDIQDKGCVFFLYNSESTKRIINNCLERIAWRTILSLAPQIELTIFNGDLPGSTLGSLEKLDKSLFRSSQKIMYDGYSEEFSQCLDSIYKELPERIRLFRTTSEEVTNRYSLLLISDFPNGFSDQQKRRLNKIINAASKSGILVFLSWDMNCLVSSDNQIQLDYQKVLKDNIVLFPKDERFFFYGTENDPIMNRFPFVIDSDLVSEKDASVWAERVANSVKKGISSSSVIRQRVLIPEQVWTKSSDNGLEIPYGIDTEGKVSLIQLCHGDPTLVHGLIGGGTGSGKSTLLHDIIIHSAWLYSPDDLQFVLLDMKSVEFGIYAGLPHVRVLSTKSDKEYGASVLSFVCDEIESRKKLFGNNSSIEEYNGSSHRVPRFLVIIDEFQNLFVKEGKIGDVYDANLSLRIENSFKKILKEGRAFGIHLLLATQEAGDIPSISSYLQQLKHRLVLKLETKGVFLDASNNIRPTSFIIGEGVHNDNFGKEGANHSFHIAFYGDENKSHKQVIEESIEVLREAAMTRYGTYSPCEKCVYRGGGDSSIQDNKFLVTEKNDASCVVYVGVPIAVKRNDVSFTLNNKRSSNIIVVGAKTDYLVSMFKNIYEQIIIQSSSASRFHLLVSSDDDFEMHNVSDRIEISGQEQLQSIVSSIHDILEKRRESNSNDLPRIVLGIVNTRFFSGYIDSPTKAMLIDLIQFGPQNGIHLLMHVARITDFELCFKEEFAPGKAPIYPRDLLRDFVIKIMIKGADNDSWSDSPREDYIGNIQTRDGGEKTKFSIYK